ncbi:hypothetical protein SeLEV6574_g04229 [Synchytrium endobioticum]|nr:hypothetical protein SeLEV6574_g04229 [Synchytrium endobioticum]
MTIAGIIRHTESLPSHRHIRREIRNESRSLYNRLKSIAHDADYVASIACICQMRTSNQPMATMPDTTLTYGASTGMCCYASFTTEDASLWTLQDPERDSQTPCPRPSHSVRLPPFIPFSEQEQLNSLIPDFATKLLHSGLDIEYLRRHLAAKPLVPIWLCPTATYNTHLPSSPCSPIVLVCASNMVPDGMERSLGFTYVQDEILDNATACDDIVNSIIHHGPKSPEADQPSTGATCVFESERISISIGTRVSAKPPECWLYYDAIINCGAPEHPYCNEINKTGSIRGKMRYLYLAIPEGKKGQWELEKRIPRAIDFVRGLLSEMEGGIRLLVHCMQGRDRSVGITLALLTEFVNEDGAFIIKGVSHETISKSSIVARLAQIQVSRALASPTRATLKRVNNYFLKHRTRDALRAPGTLGCPRQRIRYIHIQTMTLEEQRGDHMAATNGSHRQHQSPNGAAHTAVQEAKAGPYAASRYGDLLSRVSNFSIIESTLREGEQFANAFFDTETKIRIAKALDEFGVEYIELTSPAASEQSRADVEAICKLGLKAKILTHVRCHMDDARIAVQTGVDGLDVVIGTSNMLRTYSHGKDMEKVTQQAVEVINFIKSKGVEVRFSSEDSFRSDLVDLLSIYRVVDKLGVNRVGIADTVGCANPRQVYELVRTLRGVVSCDIECHFHNDTGCAIANAYAALEAGATHIDTSVLGIGERNGITPLGGLVARMYTADKDYVRAKYRLEKLREIENLVAEAVQVQVPFNNYITGYCAFTHKAGIHAKAILANPSTYEILNPEDFGMTRYVSIGHRLTGWNAVKSRVMQLGLHLTDDEVKDVTAQIKAAADVKPLGIEEVDTFLRRFHDEKR